MLETVKTYGIPKEQWLDLSTGINPQGYSVGNIPPEIWQRLPEENDGLEKAAEQYYGKCQLEQGFIATPGSQWGIQQLPILRKKLLGCGRVLLPKLGYQEHRHAWEVHNFRCEFYHEAPRPEQLESCDVCVVINPNNPAGWQQNKSQLIAYQKQLKDRDAWLVLDEAFVDTDLSESLLPLSGFENVILLRSLGKFFGLAGLRVGFFFAHKKIVHEAKQMLGPWAVSGPARFVAMAALKDIQWQSETRERLYKNSCRLQGILETSLGRKVVGPALFKTVFVEYAEKLYNFLCQQGILIRLLDDKTGVRLGLPLDEPESWTRLESALCDFAENV